MSKRAIEFLKADPVLSAVIERIGPLRLQAKRLPPFQSLAHAIVHQQLSGKAAATIIARFTALFGSAEFPTPRQVMAMEQERMLSAGLSRTKASYIRDVAEKVASGFIPSLEECDRLTDAELITRLTSIKGVGRWTVEMLLLFNMGRPDILPIHDLGVRRGYQIAYRKRALPAPEQLDRIGQRWAPYRSIAALYFWRTADFLKDGDW